MSTHIDVNDPRTARALEVLAGSSQWFKVRGRDGSKAYGIPSQRDPNRRYFTNAFTCDCHDFGYRQLPCKHVMAVRLFVSIVRAHRHAA